MALATENFSTKVSPTLRKWLREFLVMGSASATEPGFFLTEEQPIFVLIKSCFEKYNSTAI